MRQEVVDLIEATRALKVQRSPVEGNPYNIRIGGNRTEFPGRLYRLAVALEAVDRAGSSAIESVDASNPAMDAARLRMAIDGVFRWMRATGVDVDEPKEIIAEALGVYKKQGKAYKAVPEFDRASERRKKGWTPIRKLQMLGEDEETPDLDEIRKKAMKVQAVENTMGAAMATFR